MVIDDITCAELEERGIVVQYVAGTLGQDLMELFECHFLTCLRCQASIRAVVAVRATGQPRPRTFPARRAVLSVGLAVAAGIAGLFFVREFRPVSELVAIGQVDAAPVYLGVELRGLESSADSLFASGMRAYGVADYPTAQAELRRALKSGAAPEPTNFFLGASQLMLGAASEAAISFGRVIDRGGNVYTHEAHYYRALATLQLGRLDGVDADVQVARQSPVLHDRVRALERALEARRSR